MNAWRPVVALARMALIAAGAMLAAALALYFGASHYRDRLLRDVGQEEAQLGALQGTRAEKQDDLDNIKAHIDDFQALSRQGLVGEADRTGWVERLLASRERLHLPPTLGYTLKPPRPLSAGGGDDAAGAITAPVGDAPAAGDGPLMHDLEITLRDTHEEELLAFIDDYRRAAGGRFRVQSCRLADAGPSGLGASCVLRFVTLPASAPAAER